MESKYNTGVPMDINELSEEELKDAFHEWAEGSQALEQLLNEGYKQGLISLACCAGHEEKKSRPYIIYNLENDNAKKIALNIAKKLLESGLDCDVDLSASYKFENMKYNLNINELYIMTQKENGNEVFELMLSTIKETVLDEIVLPESIKELPQNELLDKELLEEMDKIAKAEANKIRIDINELSEEEIKKGIHEWARNSKTLENVFVNGYERGLLPSRYEVDLYEETTFLYELNDEVSKKMAIVVAQELVDSDLDCFVVFEDNFVLNEEYPEQYPEKDIMGLCIQVNKENKEAIFNIMSKAIKEANIDNVKLPQSYEEIPYKEYKDYFHIEDKEFIDKSITTQQIGKATANAPITDKQEAEKVENEENTKDNIKKGEEIGDDN